MTRRAVIFTAAVTLLSACGGGGGEGETVRYHDTRGLFTVHVPAANQVSVVAPQPAGQGLPQVFSGVLSLPPVPEQPVAVGRFGFAQTAPQGDRAVFQILAFDATGFQTLDDMAVPFLTGSDLRERRATSVGGLEGLLLVNEVTVEDAIFGEAVALTRVGGVGFAILEAFPEGDWPNERTRFFALLESFRAGAPTGVSSLDDLLVGAPTG